eukprot:gene919-4180_t
MSIETDHINYLIYRYLLESGFQHSSFTFGQESGIAHSTIATTHIPPGSLIAQMQRALNYVQAEINLSDEGLPADPKYLDEIAPLSLLESVQPSICEERRKDLWQKIQQNREAEALNNEKLGTVSLEIDNEHIQSFNGHSSAVFMCQWNPKYDSIATSAADGTARIWSMDKDKMQTPFVCLHPNDTDAQDVIGMDWSNDGDYLCTGYFDGHLRLWSGQDGELQQRLPGSNNSISRIKFSPNGQFIAAGDAGGTVMLWAMQSVKKLLSAICHEGSVLGLCWIGEDTFVTSGTDSIICKFGVKRPYVQDKLVGHSDEVNAVEWNSSLEMLASASDDKTVRLWSMDNTEAKHVIQHDDVVGCVAWNSAEATFHILASGCRDGNIRLVDGRRGVCTQTLEAHAAEVLCLQFSPNGRMLASGDAGCRIIIWDVETGNVLKTTMTEGVIYSVAWNADSTHLALTDSAGHVFVIDVETSV